MWSAAFHMHCFLWTDLHTGMLQATLTALCDHYPFLRAGITGKLDHIDKRRFIILFLNNAGLHTFGDWCMLCNLSQWHPHCNAKSLTNYRSFQKNTVTISRNFTGYNLVGKLFQHLRRLAFICHPRNFRKNFVSDLCFGWIQSSHSFLLILDFDNCPVIGQLSFTFLALLQNSHPLFPPARFSAFI